MRPVTINPQNPDAALREIQRASHEADLVEIAQNFSIGNAPAAQRTLNGSKVQLSAAGVGNGADTTADTLFTYSLPAGALSIVGEGLLITGFGKFAANGNNKKAAILFGGTDVGDTGTVSTSGGGWGLETMIFKTGASSQLYYAKGFLPGAYAGTGTGAIAITDTAPIIIKLTGQSPTTGAANDVVGFGLTVSALTSDVCDAFATWIADCQKGGMNRTT